MKPIASIVLGAIASRGPGGATGQTVPATEEGS